MNAYTTSFRSESASVMRMSRTGLDPCVSGISKKKSVWLNTGGSSLRSTKQMVIFSVADTLGGSPRSVANSCRVNVCLPLSKSVSAHAKMQTELLSCVSTLKGKSVEHSVFGSKGVKESIPARP